MVAEEDSYKEHVSRVKCILSNGNQPGLFLDSYIKYYKETIEEMLKEGIPKESLPYKTNTQLIEASSASLEYIKSK